MTQHTQPSLISLLAGMALALPLLTGCSPPNTRTKTVYDTFELHTPDNTVVIAEDKDTFASAGGEVTQTSTHPSLYEVCQQLRRGQDRDKTTVQCDDLMNSVDADQGIPPYYWYGVLPYLYY